MSKHSKNPDNSKKYPKNIAELKILGIVGKVKFYDLDKLLKVKCKVCAKTEEYTKWGIGPNKEGKIEAVCPTCSQQYVAYE